MEIYFKEFCEKKLYVSKLSINESIAMNKKIYLIILGITSIIIIFLTLIAYSYQFGKNGLSENPEEWGQFGDYFGGILNPLISILNLIILTYLSLQLIKIEDDRNLWTIRELSRPYGDLDFDTDLDSIQIQIHNLGLGPMIITNISITNDQDENFSNFGALIKSFDFQPSSSINDNCLAKIRSFQVSNNHAVIKKEDEITLLKIIPDCDHKKEYEEFLNFVKAKLSNYNLKIKYTDMYNREMPSISEKITFLY